MREEVGYRNKYRKKVIAVISKDNLNSHIVNFRHKHEFIEPGCVIILHVESDDFYK